MQRIRRPFRLILTGVFFTMKRILALLLACGMLAAAVPAPASGLYDSYKLTVGDATYAFNWRVYPLDAHNTVVASWSDGGKPWHVTWYRDGRKFRDQAWLVDEPYLEYGVLPEPVVWDGENLTVICSERKGAFRSVIRDGMVCPDPENYETYAAEWTERGLENRREVPEDWYGTAGYGQVLIRYGEDGFGITAGGKEIPLPDSFRTLPKERTVSLECFPYGEESCLLGFLDCRENFSERHYHVICADHGTEQYDVTLNDEDEWDVMPDGQGGFLVRNGWSGGDYNPVNLTHYAADGKPDRKLVLSGEEVVIRVGPSALDGEGRLVMYGTAVAASRRVYSVFRMTLDSEMNTVSTDVREIDRIYDANDLTVHLAQDGTPWVMIVKTENKNGRQRPVLIPFDLLEEDSDSHGLTLR